MRRRKPRQQEAEPREISPEALHRLAEGAIGLVVYCRVSSARQKEEGTIESQVMVIRDWLEARPRYVAVQWFNDDGASGESLLRPGYQGMLSWLRQHRGVAKHVLVLDASRFSRNSDEALFAKVELKRLDATVLYTDHDVDDSAAGKAFEVMQSAFAEYQKASLLMGMARGKENRLREGHGYVSTPGFGFAYTREEGEKNGRFDIVAEEAGYVRAIFERVVAGESSDAVARWLNTCGVKTRRDGLWNGSGVVYVIHNELYKGQHIHRKYKAVIPLAGPSIRYGSQKSSTRKNPDTHEHVIIPVPAIVSPELWERAQHCVRNNHARWAPNSSRRESFLLRGLVQCMRDGRDVPGSPCDHAMSPMYAGRGYGYYRCGHSWQEPVTFKGRRCGGGINATKLDAKVWEYVSGLIADPQRLKALLEESTRQAREALEDLEAQRVGLTSVAKRAQSTLDAMMAARFDPDPGKRLDERTFINLQATLTKERDDAERAQATVASRIDVIKSSKGPQLERIAKMVASLTDGFTHAEDWPFAKRSEIVHKLVERVEVYERSRVRIVCSVSFTHDESFAGLAEQSLSSCHNRKNYSWGVVVLC